MNILNDSPSPSTIKAISNKALMAAEPDYHGWPAKKQEHFRAGINDIAIDKVSCILITELFNITCSADTVFDVREGLTPPQVTAYNWARLFAEGIGEDFIYLNESMAENVSLLNFNTLYDYDHDDYLFQEQANFRDFKEYKGRDYYAIRFPKWVRLISEDVFCYANFYSLATYVNNEIEQAGDDLIDELIPHDYEDGATHGDKTKGGFVFDMKLNAHGLEKHLDELRSRWVDYYQDRWIEISKKQTARAPCVIKLDTSKPGETSFDYIFNNEHCLKEIRWRYFIADSNKLIGDSKKMSTLIDLEKKAALLFLKDAHQDIMANFDPTILKFKKKMKVIMAPGFIEDMNNLDDDSP